jgi:hypothetical protein
MGREEARVRLKSEDRGGMCDNGVGCCWPAEGEGRRVQLGSIWLGRHGESADVGWRKRMEGLLDGGVVRIKGGGGIEGRWGIPGQWGGVRAGAAY